MRKHRSTEQWLRAIDLRSKAVANVQRGVARHGGEAVQWALTSPNADERDLAETEMEVIREICDQLEREAKTLEGARVAYEAKLAEERAFAEAMA